MRGAAGGGDAGERAGSAGGVSVAGKRMSARVAPLVYKVKVLGPPRGPGAVLVKLAARCHVRMQVNMQAAELKLIHPCLGAGKQLG